MVSKVTELVHQKKEKKREKVLTLATELTNPRTSMETPFFTREVPPPGQFS